MTGRYEMQLENANESTGVIHDIVNGICRLLRLPSSKSADGRRMCQGAHRVNGVGARSVL